MIFIAGADVVKGTEGRVAAPQWPGARGPAGVREQGTFTRVPQEPGRPRRLHGKSRPEVPGDQLQARRPAHPAATGAKRGCNRGTAKRRQRSAAGRAAGSRSASYYRRRGGTDPRDPAEGRGRRAMGPLEGKMPGTPSPETISTRLQRIAELARQSPQVAFTTLAHHIDIDWLQEAYRRTRKDGAVGVDGQTAEEYAARPGGQPPVAAGPGQVRPLPGAARAAGAHPEGDRTGDPAHRDPDVRGQGPPAGGRHGAGGRLRAGLPGLLVRVPAGPLGAPGAGGPAGSG